MSFKRKTVLVFGVFDLLHPGHDYFFKKAAKKGKLIVVVARDTAVFRLKGKKPNHSERKRLVAVRSISDVTRAILGDIKQGKYSAIKKYRPYLICLGYDQDGLGRDLRARMKRGELPKIRIIKLKPHEPHRYKSSLMR